MAWREKPSTYVVCAEDRATPPEAQRGYARRAGKVVELSTGHHPMLSQPELLAKVIAEAAAVDDRRPPVSVLAAQRADDDDQRKASLEHIRWIAREHRDEIDLFGYHDPSEFPQAE